MTPKGISDKDNEDMTMLSEAYFYYMEGISGDDTNSTLLLDALFEIDVTVQIITTANPRSSLVDQI